MGGVPAETPMVSGASPTTTPFIGCLRDVLIETEIVDFNSVIYHTGVEMNTCSVETVETLPGGEEATTTKTIQFEGPEITTPSTPEVVEPESVWDIAPPMTPSTKFGQCRLPVVPSPDPDVSASSGRLELKIFSSK